MVASDFAVDSCVGQPVGASTHFVEVEASGPGRPIRAVGEPGELEDVRERGDDLDQPAPVATDKDGDVILQWPDTEVGDGQLVVPAVHIDRARVQKRP